jgi:hypothetical protein
MSLQTPTGQSGSLGLQELGGLGGLGGDALHSLSTNSHPICLNSFGQAITDVYVIDEASFQATFTLTSAPSNNASLPLVFIMRGGLVHPQYYSQLLASLVGKGYRVLTATTLVPMSGGMRQLGCPADGNVAPTALLSAYEARLADFAALPAMQGADAVNIVILAHSAGGSASYLALSNNCSAPGLGLYCGANFVPLSQVRVRGIVAYEGGSASVEGVPVDIFTAFISGELNSCCTVPNCSVESGFDASMAACKSYIKIAKLNHFGLNNYVDGPRGQVTPCAVPASAPGEASFVTSREVQDEGVQLVGEAVDTTIRAGMLSEEGGLLQLSTHPRVLKAEVSPGCLHTWEAEEQQPVAESG